MNKSASTTNTVQSCWELSSFEIDVLSQIFKSILKSGKAPTLGELGISLKKSQTEILNLVNQLEEKDILRRNESNEIINIYPISLIPTEHQVIINEGSKLFAMCAVDALGMPSMFNKSAKIISQCKWCKQKITIKIENEKIVSKSHPNILIWSPKQQETPAAEKCCPIVNFFCSSEHLKDWQSKNPTLVVKGHSAPLEQAYPCIKECWKYYGQMLRLR